MKYSHFNRRLHLYLGLCLLPWFAGYGISSILFSHPAIGDAIYGKTVWKLRFERPYELPVPPDASLKEIAAVVARDSGVEGSAGAYRPDADHINVYVHTFWNATQLTYDVSRKMLRAEDRGFRWDHFLTGLHARGGFQHDNLLSDAWAVVVDVVCLGFLVWIATGLYMWWHLPRHRLWGWLTLAVSVAAFVGMLWRL